MTIKALIDQPIKGGDHDALGLNEYANALSAFILSAETPITIGIQGDWGSGKSSMMYLIEQKIQAESQNQGKKIHTLWFNTWQFSQFNMGDNLTASLLSRFIEGVCKLGQGCQAAEAAKSSLFELLKTSATLTFHGIASVYGFGETTKGLLDRFLKKPDTNKEPSEYIETLQKQLITLVETQCDEAQLDRIVVFIDDLDRLIPQRAVEFLEALKLFLDIEGCVYVLACDYQVVAQGLRQKFGVGEADLKGRSFFDKIIQVPFNMPISQYNAQNFCENMLQHIDVEYQKEDIALYVNLITYSVGFNPRTVKRLFNNLLLLKLVLLEKEELKADGLAQINDKMRILFATLCLQYTFSPIYDYLQNYLQQVGKKIDTNQIEITEEQIKSINELLITFREAETLGEDERFTKLWQEIDTGEAFFNKCADFMGVFLSAIQLSSDSAKDFLNREEIALLKTILSFSAVVAISEKPESQPVTSDDETSTERYLNRKQVYHLMSEIKDRYKRELKALSSILSEFKKYQPRKGDRELYIRMYSEVTPPKNELYFTLAFDLDTGSRAWSQKGEKHIWHTLYWSSGENPMLLQWFENNLRDIFPKAQIDEENGSTEIILYNKKFPPNLARDKLDATFKETAFEVLDKLLPRLVELKRSRKW